MYRAVLGLVQHPFVAPQAQPVPPFLLLLQLSALHNHFLLTGRAGPALHLAREDLLREHSLAREGSISQPEWLAIKILKWMV